MYKSIIEEEWSSPIENGFNINKFDRYINSYKTVYQHGVISDLLITTSAGTYSLPSESTCNFVTRWGRSDILVGDFKLNIRKNLMSMNISNEYSSLRYECNSRTIFKPLNRVLDIIRSTRKLANRPYKAGSYYANPYPIMAAIFADNDQMTVKLLDMYSTNSLEEVLMSQQFKHWYKLIHPNTQFMLKP